MFTLGSIIYYVLYNIGFASYQGPSTARGVALIIKGGYDSENELNYSRGARC